MALLVPCLGSAVQRSQADDKPADGEWIQLFNGKNLDGWTPKIRGYVAGENFGNTFRVEDGILKVRYDQYGEFNERFGHLFFKEPFSHYILRIEYRFIGEQCKGGPSWAIRNSGAMIHGEPVETVSKDQDFPASIEVQLLGGAEKGERTTANLCTPGTNVVMGGKLITQHCTNAKTQTYRGDQWVTEPQFDERDAHGKELAAKFGRMISGGTISLQSESHPVEFRKVELKKLKE
jgi:hypothetical protein